MAEASIGKIIKNDYAAFLLVVGGPIALGIAGLTLALGFIPRARGAGGQEVHPQVVIAMGIVAIVITALLLALLARRVSWIKRVVRTGPKAQAVITAVAFFKDRGRVEFEYAHAGQTLRSGTAIMKNRQTESYASGVKIEVAIDLKNPLKALIIELYRNA